jgi:hypothetical protein
MTGRAVCSHADCDGFASITCTSPTPALADFARQMQQPAAAPEPTPPAEPAPPEPSETPVVEAAALEPWTTQDVIDSRIDVQAQYALMRMFVGEPLEAIVASHILSAVKEGALEGIYQENQQAPALRAQSLGYGWWQILPPAGQQPRIDGICMTEPGDRPPMLVMRRGTEKNAAAYDAALQNAWATCGLPPTPARSYRTTLPAKQPAPKASACANPTEGPTTLGVMVQADVAPLVAAMIEVSNGGNPLTASTSSGWASFPLEEGGVRTITVKPLPPWDVLLPASKVVDVIPHCAQLEVFRLRTTNFSAQDLQHETACMLNSNAMMSQCTTKYVNQLRDCQDAACREAAVKEYNECMEQARRFREDCLEGTPE